MSMSDEEYDLKVANTLKAFKLSNGYTDDDDSTSKLYPLNIFLIAHSSNFHSKNDN